MMTTLTFHPTTKTTNQKITARLRTTTTSAMGTISPEGNGQSTILGRPVIGMTQRDTSLKETRHISRRHGNMIASTTANKRCPALTSKLRPTPTGTHTTRKNTTLTTAAVQHIKMTVGSSSRTMAVLKSGQIHLAETAINLTMQRISVSSAVLLFRNIQTGIVTCF